MRALRSGREQLDPTSAFFDDVPWRLPPTLLALGTATWIILERLGIIDGLLGK
jgi:hypothetical protein